MTFTDLPRDWPARPLSDPVLAADVVDLCVSLQDRATGGVAVLLCRDDDTLAQPVFVEGWLPEDEMRDALADLVHGLSERVGVGSVVVALARASGPLTDADRAIHQHLIEVCRAAGVDLLGTYAALGPEVLHLPVAPGLGLSRPA